MKGDCRPQKPYRKSGDITIYKTEIEEGTFNRICKILKVKRIGDKEINDVIDLYEEAQNHECTTPDEPPNDPNDLD